jgi:hypothetical protein
MSNQIEKLESERRKNTKGLFLVQSLFLLFWLLRFFLRSSGILYEPMRSIGIAVLIAALIAQVYYVIKLAYIAKKMKSDPELFSALNNELVQLNELKSWKTAFFSTVGCLLFLGLISFIFPIEDLIFVILTAILTGSGAYNLAFLVLDRG